MKKGKFNCPALSQYGYLGAGRYGNFLLRLNKRTKTKINSIVPLYHSIVTKLDATVTSVSLEQGRYRRRRNEKRRGMNKKVLARRKLKNALGPRKVKEKESSPVREERSRLSDRERCRRSRKRRTTKKRDLHGAGVVPIDGGLKRSRTGEVV
jgi:hypothetical protein